MLNISTEEKGIGEAVLLRALEPIAGLTPTRDVARGPGRLARAMHVTLADDGADLCRGDQLFLAAPLKPVGAIGISTRIGITKDAHLPLRFFEIGSPFVSGPRRLNAEPLPETDPAL
jgi:DNA-3-methyladenine glycosylase